MRNGFLLAAMLVIGGCATVKPVSLDVDNLVEENARAVAITERPMPVLSAITPTKAQLGFLSGLAVASAGKKIVEANGVVDPALRVSSELAEQLAGALGGEVIADPVVQGRDANSEDTSTRDRADVLVDVQTSVWQLIYYKSAWGTYSITYRAKARFIDANTDAVLGAGSCSVRPEKESEWTAGYEDFAKNRKGILIRTLAHVADECAAQIGGQLASASSVDG